MAVAKPRTLSGGPEAIRGPGRRSAWRHRLPALSRVDGWLLGAIGVLALAALSLALRSDATVFLKPFSEDGYYSLAVARSMAAGHGMTIDGVTRTNGIQPLLTIIQAGLFWLARGNDLLALRLVLILYWLLYLGTGALLGWIAAMALPDPEGRATRALTTTLIYLGASYLFLHHFNGLETGLLLFLLAAAWRYRQAGAAESWPGLALFGALLGLAVLARIDASFLVVCLALAELWRWRRRSPVRGLARARAAGRHGPPRLRALVGLQHPRLRLAHADQRDGDPILGHRRIPFRLVPLGPRHGRLPLALRRRGRGHAPEHHPPAALCRGLVAPLAGLSPPARRDARFRLGPGRGGDPARRLLLALLHRLLVLFPLSDARRSARGARASALPRPSCCGAGPARWPGSPPSCWCR